MPRINCPGVVPFCPPIIGGGGIGFDFAAAAPRFEQVVPAGQVVEMARFALSTTPNQLYLLNGVVSGIEDTGDSSSVAEATLLTATFVRNQFGVLSSAVAASLGLANTLDVQFTFDGDDLVVSADNVSLNPRLYSAELEALGFLLPFNFDP